MKKIKKNLAKKKTLSIALAALNGLSSTAPIALPLAALPAQDSAAESLLENSLNRGGQILDYLFFTTAEAKAATIDTKKIGSEKNIYYDYNLEALKASAQAAAIGGNDDPGAALYRHFLQNKDTVKAFYDDVRKVYVDYAAVMQQALDSAITPRGTLALNQFMDDANASTSSAPITAIPVTADDSGNVTYIDPAGTGHTGTTTTAPVGEGGEGPVNLAKGDKLIVPGGATAYGPNTVNSGGTLAISSGGTAMYTTLKDGYVLQADTGATLLTSDPDIKIDDHIACNLTLNSGGQLTVLAGGTSHNTHVNNGGRLIVSAGGRDEVSTIQSGGTLTLKSQASASDVTLNDGYVLEADTSANLTVNYDVFITSAIASGVTLNNGGKLTVLTNNRAQNTLVNSGGILAISSGGTATNTTLKAGYVLQTDTGANLATADANVKISGGTASNITLNSGGQLTVLANNTADSTTVNNAGNLQVLSGGTASHTIVNSGGTFSVLSGGTATNNTLKAGYCIKIDSTVNFDAVDELGNPLHISGGSAGGTLTNSTSLTISSGNSAVDTTVQRGASIDVENGGTARDTNLAGGTMNIQEGGIAYSTRISNNGNLTVAPGGRSFLTYIGACDENVYGTANFTTIHSGGTQTVYSGGTAIQATVNSGGLQKVLSGGTATDSTVNSGGLLMLEAGSLLGGTTTLTGDAVIMNNGDYTMNSLTANNATVMLDNAFEMGVGRHLSISSLTGSARFIINTFLRTNQADTLSITSGTSSNTVQIAFDPIYYTGLSAAGSAVFATVSGGNATFSAAKNEFGAYRYTPTLASTTNAGITTWTITKLDVSASETVRTAADSSAAQFSSWRAENNHLLSHMDELRDASGETGTWLRTFRGSQDISGSEGRTTNQQYTALQGGYDHKHSHSDGDLFTGYTIGYNSGSQTYNRGDGDSSSVSLGVYSSWIGKNGHFVDLIAKAGKLRSSYANYLNDNSNNKITGSFANWGTSISAEYGLRKQLQNSWYIEPEAELTFSHVNAANFTASDQTNIKNDAISSLVGRLGLMAGRNNGVTHYYGKVSLLREFAAKSLTTACSDIGLPINYQQDLKDNWLEFSLGLTTKLNKQVNGYLEFTRTTGKVTSTPWLVNIGAKWNF
ncbi:MAG: autotransporter outer membrane beta-barrel domain-containing protein [Pelosinus sp.]|nr:autotransporter outer membrane beta-barrel domain-containing protein [Pelosinus sp.]